MVGKTAQFQVSLLPGTLTTPTPPRRHHPTRLSRGCASGALQFSEHHRWGSSTMDRCQTSPGAAGFPEAFNSKCRYFYFWKKERKRPFPILYWLNKLWTRWRKNNSYWHLAQQSWGCSPTAYVNRVPFSSPLYHLIKPPIIPKFPGL